MLRLSVLALSTLLLAAPRHRFAQRSETGLAAHDTVQAGDSALDAGVLRPFSLLRKLTLNRGDTVKPFGRQSEQLAPATLDGRRVRGGTTPASGPATALDQELGVRPFEWNMFGLAVSALPLRPGYRATLPVYVDRYHRVVRYAIEVLRDTSIVRASGFHAPMWEVLATADSVAPSARLWVSRRHRFVDQVLVWEPGVSIMYAR